MNLFQQMLRALGVIKDASPAMQFEQSLQNHISQMAELEHRSETEVANDLLFFALEQCQINAWIEQGWQGLSPREQEVTALVCLHYTDQEIATRLNISVNTARTYATSAASLVCAPKPICGMRWTASILAPGKPVTRIRQESCPRRARASVCFPERIQPPGFALAGEWAGCV